MKKIITSIFALTILLVLSSCSLLGGGSSKGVEVKEEEWNKFAETLVNEENYEMEWKTETYNLTNKFSLWSTQEKRDRDGSNGYYYSKREGSRGEGEGYNYYTVYKHIYGWMYENSYHKDVYNWPGDPEGSFRYRGIDGDYYLAYFNQVSDFEQFSLKFIELLPGSVLNLPEYSSVTYNSKKGCYVSNDGYSEYYFNKDGKLFKYSYSKDYSMGINKLRDTVLITISYGTAEINLPEILEE